MKFIGRILRNIITLIFSITIVWILFTKIFANGQISGQSMEPTFHNGERLFGLRRSNPKRGDIIIFHPPDENAEKYYVKRVIGLPGDLVSMKDDVLYINNEPQPEKYLDTYKDQFYEQSNHHFTEDFDLFKLTGRSQVPLNSYFVMGDNRPNSTDSRTFGFVKATSIQSIALMRYYPLNKIQFY